MQTRGNIAPAPASAGEAAADLPTMTSLLTSLLTELLPSITTLIYDPFASHCIRILLLVFSGVATSSADPKSRSKKSAQFRKGQGASLGKNWLSDDVSFTKEKDTKGKGKASAAEQRFATPPEFRTALKELYAALDALDGASVDHAGVSLPTATIAGEGVRRAALHEVAGPVLRILVELEALQPGGWAPGGWADRILVGLVSEVAEGSPVAGESATANQDLREEYLAGLLRHPASSPTFEMLLQLAPKSVFDAIWQAFFVGKVHRLAANAVANFVVAVGISRVDEVQLAALLVELRGIAQERRGEWIDNYRTGVLRALLESASRLSACEAEVSEVRPSAYSNSSIRLCSRRDPHSSFSTRSAWRRRRTASSSFPACSRSTASSCVLSSSVTQRSLLTMPSPHSTGKSSSPMRRLSRRRRALSSSRPGSSCTRRTSRSSLTGENALFISGLSHLSLTHSPIRRSIAALSFDSLLAITRSATSSRILDVLLTSPTTPPRALRSFIMSLLGHFHTIADDRIGSRVAERCFASADVYLKDKMAQSLCDKQSDLQRSAYAHFFARKLELPLWGRRRDDWKAKMARATQEEKDRQRAEAEAAQPAKPAAPAQAAEEEGGSKRKKKRERKADEVDEIFAAASASKGASAGGPAVGQAADRERDEDEERAAKKARKAEKRARDTQGMEDVLAAIKASV